MNNLLEQTSLKEDLIQMKIIFVYITTETSYILYDYSCDFQEQLDSIYKNFKIWLALDICQSS
jgi:hypothetical protein